MNRILLVISLFAITLPLLAQNGLPNYMTDQEEILLEQGLFEYKTNPFSQTEPPPFPVRTMAEWEEIQALVVTWTSYKDVLAEIIRNAKEECTVIVVTDNVQAAELQLLNVYDFDNLDNVEFLDAPYNTIWIRDYGANTVYMNDVDSLALVDWIYNRPRPLDDVIPNELADMLDLPLYSTTEDPYQMVHTGGNFQSDGMGTGFSSDLVIEENEPGNPYGTTPLDESGIDQMMFDFMGIERYIKMEALPYDVIHHIDMHMRLLDEETILVGEYPEGVADGPQIEANIQYIQDNFMSVFGTPYKFVRIQMPPDNGAYPDTWWADYRTYTNSVFVNKTMLVPTYEEQFDTTALRVYEENLPGYNVVGIECNDIIQSLGALHCITRAVGVNDPLWIVHQPWEDQIDVFSEFEVSASIKHRTGVSAATLYYTTDLALGYTPIEMSQESGTDNWVASLPNPGTDSEIFYYVNAEANSGKTINRPMTAPEGYWKFRVDFTTSVDEVETELPQYMGAVFPNPAKGITCIPMQLDQAQYVTLQVRDALGRVVETLHSGLLNAGETKHFLFADQYSAGTYFIEMKTGKRTEVQKLIVR